MVNVMLRLCIMEQGGCFFGCYCKCYAVLEVLMNYMMHVILSVMMNDILDLMSQEYKLWLLH